MVAQFSSARFTAVIQSTIALNTKFGPKVKIVLFSEQLGEIEIWEDSNSDLLDCEGTEVDLIQYKPGKYKRAGQVPQSDPTVPTANLKEQIADHLSKHTTFMVGCFNRIKREFPDGTPDETVQKFSMALYMSTCKKFDL